MFNDVSSLFGKIKVHSCKVVSMTRYFYPSPDSSISVSIAPAFAPENSVRQRPAHSFCYFVFWSLLAVLDYFGRFGLFWLFWAILVNFGVLSHSWQFFRFRLLWSFWAFFFSSLDYFFFLVYFFPFLAILAILGCF